VRVRAVKAKQRRVRLGEASGDADKVRAGRARNNRKKKKQARGLC
jgi:hypothetical protein